MDIKDKLTKTCCFPTVFDKKGKDGRPRSELAYYRCDHDGFRWWSTLWPVNVELETPELIAEFDAVYAAFVTAFPTLADLKDYCVQNLMPTSDPTEFNAFLDLDGPGRYWLRMITRDHDYNLYLHCMSKTGTENKV